MKKPPPFAESPRGLRRCRTPRGAPMHAPDRRMHRRTVAETGHSPTASPQPGGVAAEATHNMMCRLGDAVPVVVVGGDAMGGGHCPGGRRCRAAGVAGRRAVIKWASACFRKSTGQKTNECVPLSAETVPLHGPESDASSAMSLLPGISLPVAQRSERRGRGTARTRRPFDQRFFKITHWGFV